MRLLVCALLLLPALALAFAPRPCGTLVSMNPGTVGNISTYNLATGALRTIAYPIGNGFTFTWYFIPDLDQWWFFTPDEAVALNVSTGTLSSHTWSSPFSNMRIAGYDAASGLLYMWVYTAAPGLHDVYSSSLTARRWSKVTSFTYPGGDSQNLIKGTLDADGGGLSFFETPNDGGNGTTMTHYDFATKSWSPWISLTPTALVYYNAYALLNGNVLTFNATTEPATQPLVYSINGTFVESMPLIYNWEPSSTYGFGFGAATTYKGMRLITGVSAMSRVPHSVVLVDLDTATIAVTWPLNLPAHLTFLADVWYATGC